MKRLLFTASLIGLFATGSLRAQENDSLASLSAEPEKVTQEVPNPTTSEVKVVKIDSVKPAETPPHQTTPRIIYYQDTTPRFPESYNKKNRNSGSDIKTISGSMNHSGGFFGLSFRASEFRDDASIVMAGFRTGWIVNRTLGLGIEAHGIIPTTKYDDIDPLRDAVLLGGYGGMFMEWIAFSNQVVHVTFPISAGAGWLGYHEDLEVDYNEMLTR